MQEINEISFYGVPPAAGPIDGYAYAGLKLVKVLNGLNIETPWRDDSAPYSISFSQPEWFSQSQDQYRIGYTPWESTVIPERWVVPMDAMDLMWTTSHWCKDVLVSNGVTNNIVVVPHGIDSEEWTLSKRKKDNNFIFFHMGEPAVRKNGQMVYDAFLEVFGDNPNVHLWLKSNGYTTVRHKNPFGPADIHPRVKLITQKLSIEELNALHQNVHCMVYPSNGEGFGMIPFQSIATGMPTILVNWSGIEDFGHYGIEMKYTVGPTEHDYHLGDWAYPDYDNLCQKMLEVYKNYDDYADQAHWNGVALRKEFSWENIVHDAIADLKLRIKF